MLTPVDIQMAGIVNDHLYFVNEPFLYIRERKIYGITIKEWHEDSTGTKFRTHEVHVFDPCEKFGVNPHAAELINLSIVDIWVCFEEPINGEYTGSETWVLINEHELQDLFKQI